MIVTTSRKPSRKTRVFCRSLSAFFNFDYITRGKTPLTTFGDAILIGDQKGNPGSIRIYRNNLCRLSLFFSIHAEWDIKILSKGIPPVVTGTSELSSILGKLLDLKHITTEESDSGKIERKIIVTDNSIECIDSDKKVIVFKIISWKAIKEVDHGN